LVENFIIGKPIEEPEEIDQRFSDFVEHLFECNSIEDKEKCPEQDMKKVAYQC